MELTIIDKDKKIKIIKKDFHKINWDKILLATATNYPKNFIKKLREEKQRYKEIYLNEKKILLIFKNFIFFRKPLNSSSKESGAQYLAISKNIKEGLALQYLPKKTKTSHHYHNIKKEIFYSLEGEAFLKLKKGEFLLNKNIKKVNQGTAHQLITKNKDSLILIEIKNDPKGLSHDDKHIV